MFNLFDDDQSGHISLRNLKRVAKELGETMSDGEEKEERSTCLPHGDVVDVMVFMYFSLVVLALSAGAVLHFKSFLSMPYCLDLTPPTVLSNHQTHSRVDGDDRAR